jgi:hypothetical protein
MATNFVKWAKQKETWSENKVCVRCSIQYIELDNIGRWECTCHRGHKIEINAGKHHTLTSAGWVKTGDFRWSCCPNVIWTANHIQGCVPCDHSPGKAQFTNSDVIPGVFTGWLRDLKPRPDAIIDPNQNNDYVIIKRAQ